ncbi:MAG: hypothetical protein ACM3JD_04815 [Rudaea sp.]
MAPHVRSAGPVYFRFLPIRIGAVDRLLQQARAASVNSFIRASDAGDAVVLAARRAGPDPDRRPNLHRYREFNRSLHSVRNPISLEGPG